MFLKDTQSFIGLFNLDSQKLYYDPIVIRDANIGFSIKRNYPSNIRFKPPINKLGEPDEIIVIWLVLNASISSAPNGIQKVPLYIKINKFSRYKSKFFDYDFNDPKSPTKESLYQSEKTPQPSELEFIDYFFYDQNDSVFFDRAGKKYNGLELLEFVVNKHINTVHLFKGLKFRFKHAYKINTVSFLTPIIRFCIYSLKKIFGRELDKSDTIIAQYDGFSAQDFRRTTTDIMEFFGYRTSKKVIALFCLVIVLLSLLNYTTIINIEYFYFIFSHNLLVITHSIILLLILDNVIPMIIFRFMNYLIKKRNKHLFSRFRV